MTIGEIRKGISRLAPRDPSQAQVLENWLDSLKSDFPGGLIEISPAIAERWGRVQAIRSLPEIDALIAATALDRDLTLVTRNEADFAGLGVRILNPFLRI
jgi:predicted nucleic acid-binding protein